MVDFLNLFNVISQSINNPTFDRLEDQIGWYDKKSGENQKWFKRLKILQFLGGALVPFSSASLPMKDVPWVTGTLGIIIILTEAIQSLNQYQHNWITYRSTCEYLKHEKFLWLAKAGPYEDLARANAILAERVEALISTEHAKWISFKTEKDSKAKAQE